MFGFIVWLFTSLRSLVRRVYTIVRAFLTLYTMPQKMIDDFMESYTLFDEDSVNPDNSHKIQNYYAVLNHLCSLGEVEKMYIPPLMDNNASIMQNQSLYEEKMMRDMDLKPGMHVLDVGCGRGRVAAHVALHSGAHVTGINIEKTQVANGNDNAKILGISERLKIRHHDFNQLPLDFKDETFDAVYEVQAFSYIKDGNFDPLFKELHRVMKPGAKLSFLEWVSLPKFDPKNKEHQKLLKQVKPLLGAVFTPTVDDMTGSLERAGFKVVLSKIPSIDGFQYPLVMRAAKYFIAMGYIVNFLCFLRILPKYFKTLMDRFNKDGDILAKGDEMRLWTTTYQIVAQKPKSS